MNKMILVLLVFFFSVAAFCQSDQSYFEHVKFTKADTIRGMLNGYRSCFDVHFYELDIDFDFETQSIKGSNTVHFEGVEDGSMIQIDLFENMNVDNVHIKGETATYLRQGNRILIEMPFFRKGEKKQVTIQYSGTPIKAKLPPWDGGFIWRKDLKGQDWVAVACEGVGASLWWPNKDHLSDEPDSMSMQFTVPSKYMCVSNGRLRSKQTNTNDKTSYKWFVSYPINNYNVTFNIAEYAHFSDTYTALDKSQLDLNYYVLPENLEKAKQHFQQVHEMLKIYETHFGKYPFWEDGYALVETPYLGMEHQSAIAYGNQYKSGYNGSRLPEGVDFDFIIIHETGHEYWGNSISINDHAEMWIHESFTTYMEMMYIESRYNFDKAVEYMKMQRRIIKNKDPLIGPKNVNFNKWRGSDMYFKGSWILHTLRHIIDDDQKWYWLLKDFYQQHAISNITSEVFFDYMNQHTKRDLKPFFDQYFYHPAIPKLQYKIKESKNKESFIMEYRWEADVEEFQMPVKIGSSGNWVTLEASTNWQKATLSGKMLEEFEVAIDLFYINVEKL